MARYIDTADCAKLIRDDLKRAFPAVTFSVRIHRYSGGSSVRVEWVDGPERRDVEAVAGCYRGASFDGMQDLKSYHNSELNGEAVHFGADYVFCTRVTAAEHAESKRWLVEVAERKAARKAAALERLARRPR